MSESNYFEDLISSLGLTPPEGGCRIVNKVYLEIIQKPDEDTYKKICTRGFKIAEEKEKIWNLILLISKTATMVNDKRNVENAPMGMLKPVTRIGYMVKVYKWKLKIPSTARRIAEVFTGEHLYHVGIGVYNTLHHFATDGIKQQLEMMSPVRVEGSVDNTKNVPEFFITHKTRREFDYWLQDQLEEFSAANYHFYKKNCIKFAQRLFDFLEVDGGHCYKEIEQDVDSLQSYMENEKNISKMNSIDQFLQLIESYHVFTQEFSGKCKAILCSKSKQGKNSANESARILVDADFRGSLNDEPTNIANDMQLTCTLSKTGGIYDMETAQLQI